MASESGVSLSGIMKVLQKILNSKSTSISRGSYFIKIKKKKLFQILMTGNIKESSFLNVLRQHDLETVLLKRKLVIISSGESIYGMFENILTELENRQSILLNKLERIHKVVEDAVMLNSTLKMILQMK
jgi:hypothetical protein